MKSSDIVNQLAVVLPSFVDDFTTNYSVTSLTRAAFTVTVETSVPHGLTVGSQVNIQGAETPISVLSLTRNGMIGSLKTSEDHDITENAGFDVQLSGSNEPEFNGIFKLLKVPNRRNITFMMDDSGPLIATGLPLLLNGSNMFKSYNGLREITAVTSLTAFEYTVTDDTLFTPASGTITAKTSPRISSSVEFERVLNVYTKQGLSNAWLFVVLGDSLADKNRNIDTDSTDNIQSGNYFNQRIIQNLTLYVFLPTTDEIAASDARDRCEELLKPICNSILGAKFPSLVENNNNPLMLSGHGLQAYNTAFYAHQYAFEATLQLGPSDIYVPQNDVAFRDIDLSMTLQIGTEEINTLINLDDEPL